MKGEVDWELNDDGDPDVAAAAMGSIWLKHPVWRTNQPANHPSWMIQPSSQPNKPSNQKTANQLPCPPTNNPRNSQQSIDIPLNNSQSDVQITSTTHIFTTHEWVWHLRRAPLVVDTISSRMNDLLHIGILPNIRLLAGSQLDNTWLKIKYVEIENYPTQYNGRLPHNPSKVPLMVMIGTTFGG